MTADASCDLLRAELLAGRPFLHTKWGDGAIRVMHGLAKPTQHSFEGECVWQDLAAARYTLWRWWEALRWHATTNTVFMGDWVTCSDPEGLYIEWASMVVGGRFQFVQYEALLLHRLSPALLNFYRALRACGHKKLLVTSAHLAAAAAILAADLLLVPPPAQAHPRTDESAARAVEAIMQRAPDVVLLCCGGIGQGIQPMLIEAGYRGTQINLGSAMDPLILGRTRSGQVESGAAKEYFKELIL